MTAVRSSYAKQFEWQNQANKMTTLPIEQLNIAQLVCLRPAMFTANGSLSEVLAFFDGYEFAQQNGSRPAMDSSPSHVLDWLRDQLANQLAGPQERVAWMLQTYRTEQEALTTLAEVAASAKTSKEVR